MEAEGKTVNPGTILPSSEECSPRTNSSDRRSFLGWFLGICTLSVGALLSVPLLRFVLYPLRVKTTETSWSDLGDVGKFAPLTSPVRRLITVEHLDGWRKAVFQRTVYVTKDANGQTIVLSAVCPHLGCSVPWNEAQGQFICPCHAGVFACDGKRISGPPPRGMDTLETTVKNGRLMVRYQFFRQLVPTKDVMA
jgi:menaquinol-cytochrome c reductase iron-sulfur subunit